MTPALHACRPRQTRARWAIVLFSSATALAACGVPIFHVANGYGVVLVNGTDAPVIAHERLESVAQFSTRRIEAGNVYDSSWNVPSGPDDKRMAQVDATDAAGNLIF